MSPRGKFYIAELHGNFRQMGRQYGNLLGEQIQAFYREVYDEGILKMPKANFAELAQSGEAYYASMPQMFKEFVDGVAETNGLNAEKTRIQTATVLILAMSGCSSLSAWGDYTGGGPLVVGRNLDLASKSLGKYAKYWNVLIWNPEGYGHSVAHIDYVGGLFYQTAFNSKGIFLELQNGQASDKETPKDRENTNHALLASLFSASSMADMENFFQTTRPQAGLIMNASSPEKSVIYEWATFRTVRREGPGLISASNDFLDPSWKEYKVPYFNKKNEGVGQTYTRRTNLLDLGRKSKGKMTPQAMMRIFDTPIPQGGATFPDDGVVRSIYQVVAVPAELKMWLKVRGYSEWEEIDLKKYFQAP
ncbi:MAG: C45 family autoproteolytic acyltransferase/hydrolase [Elusimicrobia bacterium]|nr:C45 family autoproteolytic acyltransferase/hydrolase [Elusimicrobiota bacterium]